MAAPTNDADELAARVQKLPAELSDEIYQHVFTSDRKEVEITSKYKPPAILQVDRNTRQELARDYYLKNCFVFDGTSASYGLMGRWVLSLSWHHRNCVRDIWMRKSEDTKLGHRRGLQQYWCRCLDEVASSIRGSRERRYLESYLARRLVVEATIQGQNGRPDEVYLCAGGNGTLAPEGLELCIA